MTEMIERQHFLNPFFTLLEEAFETSHSLFLDKNTSLFHTLETISAQQASILVGGKCASLAAQVAHITFFLELSEHVILYNEAPSSVDCGEIWRTVEKVTPDEWQALKDNLKQAYTRLSQLLRDNSLWNENTIGESMSLVVHTAYHLGEIRQALCVLR